MRIILLQQFMGRREKPIFPLGLACLASGLKGHELKVVDPNLYSGDNLRLMLDDIKSFHPDMIASALRNVDTSLSYDNFSYFEHFRSVMSLIRRNIKGVSIAAGGPGFSLFPEEVMDRVRDIDYGISGEGEDTFADLVRNPDDPSAIKGLYLRRNGGETVFTGQRPFVSPDALARIPWGLFNVGAYNSGRYQIGIQTKRGCPEKCLYCTYSRLEGSKVRFRNVEAVLEDMESLSRLGVKSLFFCDAVFNSPLENAALVCEGMIRRRLRMEWTAYFNEKFITSSFVDLALKSGCRCFQFSPDAVSDKTLRRLGKIQTPGDMRNAYSVLGSRKNASVKVYFLMNPPDTDFKDIFRLACFIFAHVLRRWGWGSWRIHAARIYPGTALHSLAVGRGLLAKDTDLLNPVFYDPFPWKMLSFPLNFIGRVAMSVIRILRMEKLFY